ncbi:hypothetical protein [Actinokineospora bangkokensis]|uniref:DUF2846 domain-containing protein n=1 Tax=Actinokineospora bangkokensis TaxID=1193682 RepID=A0A1Q9LIT2_9PSEU|nr:hypothetical protein [Actinokineospora bangkokensis]OLR91961.1 hypothetical protein BJP25_24390 [Actinokineospora bangkokensis]
MPLRHEVRPLSGTRLPFLLRRKLRAKQRAGATGILYFAKFRVPPRNTLSRYYRVVTVFDGRSTLCGSDPMTPASRWRDLPPGTHDLRFVVQSFKDEASFHRSVQLAPGQVLVALCVPAHSFRPFAATTPPEVWYLGVV